MVEDTIYGGRKIGKVDKEVPTLYDPDLIIETLRYIVQLILKVEFLPTDLLFLLPFLFSLMSYPVP